MKILSKIAVLLSAALLFSSAVYAADERTPYNWYCKNNTTHTQPRLDENMKFIDKYDAYYVDKASEKEKVIYLTFDAGYENGNVGKILDVMKSHNVKGSFFILDNLIVRAPELVLRMKNEGHLVCNHTRSHPDMTKLVGKETFAKQLSDLDKSYSELTGCEMSRIYRPPQGRFSEQNLKYAQELGYKTVFWSFAYADWDNERQPDCEKAIEKILAHTHNGEIMLLHPTSATNAAIMDRLLCELEKQGYTFALLNELWE